MTTIVFTGGFMAADSKCTADGYFSTRLPKIYRLPNRGLVGCAGDADVRDVLDAIGRTTAKNLPSRHVLAKTETDFEGILVYPKGEVFYIEIGIVDMGHENCWSAAVVECRERFAAVGSGQQFALGALANGATAKQAIEIACRFDTASGPPVIVVPLVAPPRTLRKAKP